MANLLDAVAGTYGFINAMGLSNGVGDLATVQGCPALTRVADCFDFVSGYSPAPVALTFAQRYNVFVATYFNICGIYTNDPGSSAGEGFPAKTIVFYNSQGKPIFSLGSRPMGTLPDAFSVNSYKKDMYLYIFFYGDTSSTAPTSYEPVGNSVLPAPANGSLSWTQVSQLFTINYVWDATTPANSKIEIFIGNVVYTIADVATKIQVTEKRVAKVTFGGWLKNASSANSNIYYGATPISYIVAMDGIDYTAKATVLYPTAFTANNTFSGAIAAINTSTQDTTYAASASEVSAMLEVELADFVSIGKSDRIMKLDLYTFLRYVQAGGASVNFTCALVDAAGGVHASAVVTVGANESETMCRTNEVLSALTSQVTSGSFALSMIQPLRVRISL